ncbi:substrate-binding periplasmic protein [Psychromonas ossibalaenae]|uniref:substrate-binding periplasmic protein n=1 Tax=Psychromonas ossibalaenae TaxID=444922 RepID=UPI000362ED5F|nr:transporter substrate-binding domain-containing protein [Psychromonas ossibalaenae]
MLLIHNCKKILTVLALILFGGGANAQGLNEIEVLTEAYPPYNFRDGGILKGIAVDLLVAATHKVQSPIKREQIKLQPWARAYRRALDGPNVALFSTTRSEERESKFKWVGPITKTRIVILAKRSSNIKISSVEDLNKYNIGVIRDDIGEQLIIEAGVPESKIQRATKADSLAKKLNAGRVQLWAYEENVARWFIKTNNLENDDFVVVHTLKEGELYYAFSKDVDDALTDSLQKGLDQVKSAPGKIGKTLYDDILSNYL